MSASASDDSRWAGLPSKGYFNGRPGGRPKGSRNKKTLQRAFEQQQELEKLAAERLIKRGYRSVKKPITPMEMMNEQLQYEHQQYLRWLEVATEQDDQIARDRAEKHLARAGYWAEKLAPFVHVKPVAPKEQPKNVSDLDALSDEQLAQIIAEPDEEAGGGRVIEAEDYEEEPD